MCVATTSFMGVLYSLPMVVHDGVRPIARRRRARLVSIEREGGTLGGLKLLVALFGEVEQCVEFGAVERAVFGGAWISMKSPDPVIATFMSVIA